MDLPPDAPAPVHARDTSSILLSQLRRSISETWLLQAQVQLSLARGYLDMLRTCAVQTTRLKLYQRAAQLHEAARRSHDKIALGLLPALDTERYQDLERGLAELADKLLDVLQAISNML
jgi:hypothetical protein